MQKTILIVDDEPGMLLVIKHFLELYNYNVLTAPCGREAMDIVRNTSDISFILSDMRMEDGNGLQLLETLNVEQRKIPFLLITGFADISLHEIVSKGAIGIMNKPFDIERLLDIIKVHTSQ